MEDEVVLNPNTEGDDELAEQIYKEEPVKRTRRGTKQAKKKVSSFKLDPSKYKETEEYAEKIPVRQLNKRGQIVTEMTPTNRTLEREVFSVEFVKEWGHGSRDNKNALHRAKCVFRACESFGVSPEHLKDGYIKLSGKKIDGFYATDLIDRFGFSDGQQSSRAMLRDKYKKTSINSVDIAQEKLYTVLNTANVGKAYGELIKDIKEDFVNELRDKVVYGE